MLVPEFQVKSDNFDNCPMEAILNKVNNFLSAQGRRLLKSITFPYALYSITHEFELVTHNYF